MGEQVQEISVFRDRNQAGCISGLISIFDFCLGRSSQQLLPDRKHGSDRFSIGKKTRTASVDFQEPEYSHLDLVSLMEEFCNHVHQRLNNGDSSDGQESTSSTSNDHLDELNLQLVQKHTILEEKLSEAAKSFLSQKFIDSGQMTDEAKIQQTKQFMDALDILNSNKDLLLKLLEDSNSLQVKHNEYLRGSQPEKGETKKLVATTKASEEEIDNLTQCQELVVHKETPKQNMYKFFWRKVKSENKNASKDLDSLRASSRIVVLKPNPAAIKNSAAVASLTSPRSSTQFLSATPSQNCETELHTDDDFQTDDAIQIQALDLNPDTSRDSPETVVQEINLDLEGDSILEGAHTIETMHKEESKFSDDPCETTNSNMPDDEKSSSTETNRTLEEEGSSESLMDENRNNEPSMSSLDSSCLLDLKVEALESSSDGGPAWESPVSVLKPFFLDDASSPATPKSDSAEMKMKPVRFCFDEQDSTVVVVSPSDPELHSAACIEDKKPTFEYVRAVLCASGLSWDDFTNNYESSSHLLDASLIDGVEVPSSRLCGEPKLIFNCIDDVLVDLYQRYFGCPPWLKFIKSDIRPAPMGNSIIQVVWEIMDSNLIPQPQPCTLDHIVGKDFIREGSWPNLQLHTEDIGIEISEAILIELIQEALFDMRSLVELSS